MSTPTTPPGTATDTDTVVRTEDLTKVYPGGLKAVDTLNLSLNRGEIFGLLGPNGAGKTTTVGMLTTMVVPTAGRAWVGGVDVIAHPALSKQSIGVVPQSNTLDRSLSVWENLDVVNYVALPAIGAEANVISFQVPGGRNGIIRKVANNFVGGGEEQARSGPPSARPKPCR